MIKIKPRKIYGSWTDGYVLDLHTTSSTYVGDDEFGHPQFSTQRTEIGELLFQLKYRSDEAALAELVEAGASFIKRWGVQSSLIVPIPPTRSYRKLQPVARLAEGIGAELRIPVAPDAVRKQKQFAELEERVRC